MNLFLFDLTKTKKGAKTAPLALKMSYFDGRAPQLSARVNHGTPAAGMIGHMHYIQNSGPKTSGISSFVIQFYYSTACDILTVLLV